MVTAGTVLAKLNDADLQAQMQKIKVQLALANINEQRNYKLLEAKGINQSDYDISLQQVNSLKADIAYTQSLIDKTVIKAPFAGQMGLKQVSLGAYISTASTIVTLQKVDQLKVDFTLPEIYQNYIKVGKNVSIESIANPGVKMIATIAAIEPQIIATSRNIKVRANLKGKLLPGAYTKVFLGENQQKPSILVPTNIIIPDSKVKQLVVVREGKAKFINVETGYRTASAVEITAGVKVGDSLVVAGMLFVRDGSDLKIGKTLPLAEIIK
jgi:membrane fusion protein (multidrug efflux system)